MRINSKLYLILILVLLSSILSSCDFGKIKSTATVGTLNVTVDENVAPFIQQEKLEYERLNTEAKVDLKTAPTKNAFAQIINHETSFIVVTRDVYPEEQKILTENKTDLKKYEIAVDAIGFVINKDNPVLRMTSEDIKKIFSGEITKWTDIKAQSEDQNKAASLYFKTKSDIKVFIQRKNSFTYDYVKDSILGGKDYIAAAEICSTSAQMLEKIRMTPNSIGISNLSWLSIGDQEKQDSSVKTVRVSYITGTGRQYDYTELHQGLVYNQTYPFRRKVYVFTTDSGISNATGFLTFLRGTDGQKIALKYGLVPVTQPVRTIQLN